MKIISTATILVALLNPLLTRSEQFELAVLSIGPVLVVVPVWYR